jgi:putative flippase GtrA
MPFNLTTSGPSAEFLRYLIIGGLNAALTFLVFIGGLYTLRVHYLLALVVAFFVGNIFTYILNFIWVFRVNEKFSFRVRFLKYLFPNTGTFIANLVVLYLLVDFFGSDPLISQVVLMFMVVLANFLFAKYCAFAK